MAKFDEGDNFLPGNNSEQNSVSDCLECIDQAYERGARETCIRLIDDLYALFDRAAGGAALSCVLAGYESYSFLFVVV